MTDRDRLIELLQGSRKKYINLLPFEKELIADYLLANGVIVPPCKVGDKFYWINFVTKEIETDIVVAIHQYKNGFKITTNTIGSGTTCTFVLDKFIRIMFSTKEQAELKLKELKENG